MFLRGIFTFLLIGSLSATPDLLDKTAPEKFSETIPQRLTETCRAPQNTDKKHWIPRGLTRDETKSLTFSQDNKPSETLRKLLNPPKTPGCDRWILDASSKDTVEMHLFVLRILGDVLYNDWVINGSGTLRERLDPLEMTNADGKYKLPETFRIAVVDAFLKRTSLEHFPELIFSILNHTARYPQDTDRYRVPTGITERIEPVDQNGQRKVPLFGEKTEDPARVLKKFLTLPMSGGYWEIDCAWSGYIFMNLAVLKQLDDIDLHEGTYNWMIKYGILNRDLALVVRLLLKDCANLNRPIIQISERGHFGYIINLGEYGTLFFGIPNSIHQGINLATCGPNAKGEPTYIGFSSVFANGPLTKAEIYEYLIGHTVTDPIPQDDKRFLIKSDLQRVLQLAWENQKGDMLRRIEERQSSEPMSQFSSTIVIPQQLKSDIQFKAWAAQRNQKK